MIGFKSLTSSLTSKLILWATFKINKFVCILLLILFYLNLYLYPYTCKEEGYSAILYC